MNSTTRIDNFRYNRLMLPACEFLDHLHIPYQAVTFPPTTPKGAANVAQALRLREHQAIKTLIFESERSEPSEERGQNEGMLVMVGGDQNVISGLLKKAAGSRNIHLASPESVIQTTGYVIGSIPPFGWQPEGFRSFLDQDMMDETILAVGAGVWGNEILITPANLVIASRAKVVNLTIRDTRAW